MQKWVRMRKKYVQRVGIRRERRPLNLPGLLVKRVSQIFLFVKTACGIKLNTITVLAHLMSEEHQAMYL